MWDFNLGPPQLPLALTRRQQIVARRHDQRFISEQCTWSFYYEVRVHFYSHPLLKQSLGPFT